MLNSRFQLDTLFLCLLLNPPSDHKFHCAIRNSLERECSPFFPLHTLHLDLTCWAVPIVPTINPLQGGLTTEVYRRVEQEGVRFNGDYRF